MTAVDLFTGIGGFTLAAHANGIETICFVEKDKRCREFLAKAWPGIKQYDDIKTFPAEQYRGADFVFGGPPCQPVSTAGKRKGADDDRWLWDETLVVIKTIGPAFCLLENPSGIRTMGLDGILSELESYNYATRTFSIPACAVGAPHRRERYWIVGHRTGESRKVLQRRWRQQNINDGGSISDVAQPGSEQCGSWRQSPGQEAWSQCEFAGSGQWSNFVWLPCADGKLRRAPDDSCELVDGLQCPLPEMVGPFQTSLLAALGNSIVPQVASVIIHAIVLASN